VVVPSTSFKHLYGGQSSSLGENSSTFPFVTHHTATFSTPSCIFFKWNSSPTFHLFACYNFLPILRVHQTYFVSFEKLQCKIPIPTYVRLFTSLTHYNFKHHLLEVCELTFTFEGDPLPFSTYHVAYIYTQTKHAQIIGPIKIL
jgi:hypothetical protein